MKMSERLHGRGNRVGKATHWIAGAIKHPGALHRDLGIPQGKKIPEEMLEAAAKRKGVVGRRARLAETLRRMHH